MAGGFRPLPSRRQRPRYRLGVRRRVGLGSPPGGCGGRPRCSPRPAARSPRGGNALGIAWVYAVEWGSAALVATAVVARVLHATWPPDPGERRDLVSPAIPARGKIGRASGRGKG